MRQPGSQGQEDAVVRDLLERLEVRRGWCVEFGAWDGRHLSNTWRLITDDGFAAVLIESDRRRFADLMANYEGDPNVITLNRFVGWSGDDSLDAILADTPVPLDFDVLSIDIDGNDYHVWDALRRYRPKLVIVEFNPSIPHAIDFVQPRDSRVNQGSSLRALTRLARAKGYDLAAATELNAVFADARFRERLGIDPDAPLEAFREDRPTYLFQGYDGTIFVEGVRRLPWHGIPFSERRLQQLPRILRRHPDAYGRVTWRLFRLFRALRRLRQPPTGS